MPRRRVRVGDKLGLQRSPNVAGVDSMEGLSDLVSLADLAQDQGLNEEDDLRGTADMVQQDAPVGTESAQVTPTYPERYEPLPEGLDALAELEMQPEDQVMKPRREVEEPSDLQDPLETIRLAVQNDPTLMDLLPPETQAALQETSADPYRRFTPSEQELEFDTEEAVPEVPLSVQEALQKGPVEEVTEEDIPRGEMEPMQGAVEVALSDDNVKSQLERLYGATFPDGVLEHARDAQQALTQNIADLDEQARDLRERLDSNQATDFDKLAVGIAIALPVILGLMYGKEAFVSALGGTFGGLYESQKAAQEGQLKTLEQLGEVQQKRSQAEEKRQSIKTDLLKSIDNPQIRKLLRNYDLTGDDGLVVGDNLGITGKDPDRVLWYNVNLIRNDDDAKEFQQKSGEARQALAFAQSADKSMREIEEIMDAIADQNPGLLDAIKQNWNPVTKTIPGMQQLTIDIVGDDGKAKTVQALPLLKQKITAMQDVYNKEFLTQSRLTEGIQSHFQDVLGDPTKIASWIRSDFPAMREQARQFRSIVNDRLISNLVGQGWLRKPLEQHLRVAGLDILNSPKMDMKEIEDNPEAFADKIRKK